MARIVKRDLNISGMETGALIRHHLTLLRAPYVDTETGPKAKQVVELLYMHSAGFLLVKLENSHPGAHRVYLRIGRSLAFRGRRYLNLLRRRLGKEPL